MFSNTQLYPMHLIIDFFNEIYSWSLQLDSFNKTFTVTELQISDVLLFMQVLLAMS